MTLNGLHRVIAIEIHFASCYTCYDAFSGGLTFVFAVSVAEVQGDATLTAYFRDRKQEWQTQTSKLD